MQLNYTRPSSPGMRFPEYRFFSGAVTCVYLCSNCMPVCLYVIGVDMHVHSSIVQTCMCMWKYVLFIYVECVGNIAIDYKSGCQCSQVLLYTLATTSRPSPRDPTTCLRRIKSPSPIPAKWHSVSDSETVNGQCARKSMGWVVRMPECFLKCATRSPAIVWSIPQYFAPCPTKLAV